MLPVISLFVWTPYGGLHTPRWTVTDVELPHCRVGCHTWWAVGLGGRAGQLFPSGQEEQHGWGRWAVLGWATPPAFPQWACLPLPFPTTMPACSQTSQVALNTYVPQEQLPPGHCTPRPIERTATIVCNLNILAVIPHDPMMNYVGLGLPV